MGDPMPKYGVDQEKGREMLQSVLGITLGVQLEKRLFFKEIKK